jgi:predicted alpha-1,6-mannanase (GH76 family)
MKLEPKGLPIWILAATGCITLLEAAPAKAVTPGEADIAFNSLNQVYWDAGTKFFRKEETGEKKADFWLEAQLWDTVMDQYDRTRSETIKHQINDLYDGFMVQYPDWTTNKYNDDIMWWTIGCTRAYKITKDARYLKQAKASFDFVYNTFCDTNLGGGIWWTSDRRSKNSCIESPAVIAAVRLSDLLNDVSYFDKAKGLYQWQKTTLTDGKGKVYDSIRFNPVRNTNTADLSTNTRTNTTTANTPTNRFNNRNRNRSPLSTFSLTYNQGTYIGASVLLYLKTKNVTYLAEAKNTADWTRSNLCTGPNQILRNENQGDGGAFKGIFVRYMKLLVRDCGCTEYVPWMQANADTAWRNRRPSDNIMGYDWSVPTGSRIQSQSAASAVSLVLCFSDEPKN